jgi:hypothetical protein
VSGGEFVDFPGWLVKALVAEKLPAREWQLAERLRERFLQLGVELEAISADDGELRGIEARRPDGRHVAGELLEPQQYPVYEALHRLCQKTAEVLAER